MKSFICPKEIAKLAKLAGMKYMVFTAKHHAGFCMFKTETTPFNVMNTPYRKDITKELVDAFRAEGIAIGIYFSPEDFLYFYRNNIPIGRLQHPMHYPINNKGLMDYDKRQLKELLTNYGKIDVLFIDGPGDGLREYAWGLNPDLVITRDAMKTPEQFIPDQAIERPWEACYTSGTEWSYKAGNDNFKSGQEAINKLIEIRAKGGNLLLNVGPTPEGEIRIEESNILREVGMWMLANREAIYDVKPFSMVREGDVYYSQSNDESTIYAYVLRKNASDWPYSSRKLFTFSNLTADADVHASVLSFGSELVEYKKGFDAKATASPSAFGLQVSAVNGQRFYTDNKWNNAIVIKLQGAKRLKETKSEVKIDQIDGAK